MRKRWNVRLIWCSVLVLILALSACAPIIIPVDLGNLGIPDETFQVPSGTEGEHVEWLDFTIRAADVQSASSNVPGKVRLHNIQISGKVTITGDLKFDGFIGFSTTNPSSISNFPKDKDIKIDTAQSSNYDFSVTADESPSLKAMLQRLNNGEDVRLWVILGCEEYQSQGGATVTVSITNVKVWVTWSP